MTPFSSSKSDATILIFQWYRHAHAKDMPLRAIARLIQTMLYAKRFFPYYVYNILGGIEEDGSSFPPPHSNLILTICQELVLSTPLIPSGHMSVRLAGLPVPLSPSSSLSSTTRQVSFSHSQFTSSRVPFPPPLGSMHMLGLPSSTRICTAWRSLRPKCSRGVFLS